MRFSRWLFVAAASALFPLSAFAGEVSQTLSAQPPSREIPRPLPRLGLMVDAGLPDGANAALVFRPFRWLRAHGGGGYNMVSPGVPAQASP